MKGLFKKAKYVPFFLTGLACPVIIIIRSGFKSGLDQTTQ